MKKTHAKRAIDKLFEQCPIETESIVRITIQQLTITNQDEDDTDTYMEVEFLTGVTNYIYDKPKYGSVTFNVTK